MTPEQLKASILQLAIQGKLVEQRPEEGTAEELYQQIQAEKQRLIKEGKIKKDKPLPDIAEDEKPFDIPESWKWVRIGQIFNLQAGKNITSADIYSEASNGNRYLCYGGNGCRGYVSAFNREGHYALIGRQGALCGNINVAEGQFYATEHAIVVEHFNKSDVLWCAFFLKALNLNQYATATAQPGLAVANIIKVPIPLPPLAEQKRIVAKIEELLPLVDRYAAAYEKLEQFTAKFPEDMKKSILQYAIQGKLVEQRPEEGTGEELYRQIQSEKQRLIKEGKIKKEKPLPEIAEDEIPFDIPGNWKWVRLLDVVEEKPANGFSPKGVDYQTAVKNLTLTATTSGYFKADAFKYVDIQLEPDSKYWLKKDDLLIQRSNSRELVGTSCIYTGDDDAFIYPDLMMKLRVMNGVDVKYVDHVLKSPLTRNYFSKTASGTSESMPKINQGIVSATLIPLPPLAEQKRIVAKLEEILPLCERLK